MKGVVNDKANFLFVKSSGRAEKIAQNSAVHLKLSFQISLRENKNPRMSIVGIL